MPNPRSLIRRTIVTAMILLTIAAAVSLVALWFTPDPHVAQIAGTVSIVPLLLGLGLIGRAQ